MAFLKLEDVLRNSKHPILHLDLALNGNGEEVGALAAIKTAQHLKIVAHLGLRQALRLTAAGEPANLTLVLEITDPVKFADQIGMFDILFWTLAEKPAHSGNMLAGTVYTQDGYYSYTLGPRTIGFLCTATTIPDCFILAL